MKILFPFVGDSIGGSHISTLELYLSLLDSGTSAVVVLHKGNGPLSQYLKNRKIPFLVLKTHILAGKSPGKLSILIGMLVNFFYFGVFIRRHKIDIVHGNDLRINLSWAFPALFFSKGFVWHQRTLLSGSKFWVLIRYLCSYFIAISDVVMKSSPKNIPNNKKGVVYNPFKTVSSIDKKAAKVEIIKKYNLPSNCFLIGCVGRVVEYKNIEFIINNVYYIYHNLNKNIYLIIVGYGDEEYLNKLKVYSSVLGIEDRIIWTGFVNSTVEIMASLDLLVAPSLIDAFGRTIVEAMIQKTPVLAAKSGGHLNIIIDKVNGFFYNPKNENNFTDIFSIIVNNTDVKILTDNAYKFACTNFSSKRHLDDVLPIYKQILKN